MDKFPKPTKTFRMKQKRTLRSGCTMVFTKINSYGLNSFKFEIAKRWNHLSESMKNIAIENHLKNKFCNRMHSIITFTFRGRGCIIFLNLVVLLKDIKFWENKFWQHLFLQIWPEKNRKNLCCKKDWLVIYSQKLLLKKFQKRYKFAKINVSKIIQSFLQTMN